MVEAIILLFEDLIEYIHCF